MAMSPYLAQLRSAVGHDLLLLPSVSVLPTDGEGRVLLVRHLGDDEGWTVLGGVVEVGESPRQTAVREAREEIGVEVRLTGLLDVLGGPDYEVTYPHGDRCAYVTTVYTAEVIAGLPAPDEDEVAALNWFSREELHGAVLNRFARALLTATGHLER